MKELTLDAKTENLDRVTGFLEEFLEHTDVSVAILMKISVALEEMFVNVANYAYTNTDVPEEDRKVTVRLEDVKVSGADGIKITLTDRGKPYDPLAKADPDTTQTIEDRPIGGMGILIVKKSMDAVNYEYKDGKNILTIKKNFDSESD